MLTPRECIRRAGAPGPIAAVFGVVALVAALQWRGLIDDEGYYTWLMARVLWAEPLATGFYLKCHPFLSAAYALPSALGWPAFLGAHVLVAALTVWLVGRVAERLGGRGWVASAIVAVSPTFFVCATAGQSNVDGIATFALALYWYTGRGRVAGTLAGLTMVAGLLGRFEFAPLFLGFLAHAGIRRRWRVVAAAGAGAVAYWLGGAAYHGDPWWPLDLPPTLLWPMPYHGALFESQRLAWSHLGEVGLMLAAVTPFWPVLAATRWRDLPDLARWCAGLLALAVLLMVGLPAVGGVGYFPHIDRHFLVVLPLLALGASFAGRRSPVAASPARRAVLSGLVVVAVAASVGANGLESQRWPVMRSTRDLLAVLQDRIEPGRAIYTNVKAVDLGLQAGRPAVPVRFLLNHEMVVQFLGLMNPATDQAIRIADAMSPRLYGTAVWPCRLGAEGARRGDLLVLKPDVRVSLLYPVADWLRESEPVAVVGGVQVRTFTVDRPSVTPPGGFGSPVLTFPCDPDSRAIPVALP